MTLANRLTLLRFVLTPVVAVAMLARWPGWEPISILLVAGIALTDLFDGIVARRRGQVSEVGILIDPIADKFFISTVFICLVAGGLAPAWVPIVIIGREFAVTALRMRAVQQGTKVPVRMLGKVKMHVQVYAVLIVLFGAWFSPLMPLGAPALWIAAGVTLWSGLDYFARSRQVIVGA